MIIPAWCFLCHSFIGSKLRSPSNFLCSACFEILPRFDAGLCLKCGRSHDQLSCQIEWSKDIRYLYSLFAYQEPVKQWISSVKYSRNFVTGRLFQQMIKIWIKDHHSRLNGIHCIAPIPIHPFRLNNRGFNQAVYLLNKQKELKTDLKLLKKASATAQQAGKSRKERKESLKNAFKVMGKHHGKNILLFDDVCTTGQTLAEASKTLKRSGVENVDALVVCRSLKV